MSTCSLCELPTPDPPVTGDGIDGGFCCRGCLEVARALEGTDDLDREEIPAESRTEREIPEDAAERYFAIDGMHCTTCEAFLGLRGDEVDGIYSVEANYATETSRVVYDPDRIDPGAIPETLSGYGYAVRPRDDRDDGRDGCDVGDGHNGRRRQRDTVERLVVGGFLAMLVMPWYVFYLYPDYVGIETGILDVDTTTALTRYLPLVFVGLFTTAVLFYTGYPLLRGAWVSIRTRQPNMDLLVAIAALSAYGYSTVALATGSTHLYYDVTVAVVMVVTLGRYYEGRIRSRATGALSSITAARVREATKLTDVGRETVHVGDVDPGDRLVIAPGERVPVDGTVMEGIADVDESVLTGESLPVTKEPGDEVVGGSIVVDDALIVAAGPEGESTVDRIATTLWEIQSHSLGIQRLADTLATIFVPTVLALGIAVALWQLLSAGTVAAALLAGLTVLVVSCPCAMGLATPLAVSAGLRDALQRGIIVANESTFEVAPDADVVVFDKTGTLTTGETQVTGVAGHDGTLRLAAAVERFASHPVADAILETAGVESSGVSTDGGAITADNERTATVDAPGESLPEVEEFTRHPGEGVSGTVGSRRVVVGTSELVRDRVGPIPDELTTRIETARSRGELPVVVGWDERARGVIAVADRERDGWESAVEAFADREIVILTGDEGAGVERFRDHPAVDRVFAGVPPDGKVETVRRFASIGTTVMIGDGTNDAPALAAADLGIAIGDGTARAIDAADVVIGGSDLTVVGDVFSLARGTRRRIRENLAWAFLYNAIAVPLAVVGLINPLFAALAMAASSLVVVSNSRRSIVD